MTDILVASNRAPELRQMLEERLQGELTIAYLAAGEQASEGLLDAQIAFGSPDVLAPLVSRMPRLRWAQSTWAGVTPFLAEPRRDYVLTGVKGLFGASMSEYALGWILALRRSILVRASAKRWSSDIEEGLSHLRLGIAGVGDIGAVVARRAKPFFADVVGLNSNGRDVEGCSRCFATQDLLSFATGLDALLMLLPDTEQTAKLINRQVLSQMNHGAIVINAGRGASLNLEDAQRALKSRQLSALVLDVLEEEPLDDDSPLWSADEIYITSHTAAPTNSAAVTEFFLSNLKRFQCQQALHGVVDFAKGY